MIQVRKICYPMPVSVVDGVPLCPHCQEPMVQRDGGWMCADGVAVLDALAPTLARIDALMTEVA